MIRVDACGACHSDLHVADGDWTQLAGIVKRPLILGHEIAGHVVEKGGAVQNLQIGDRVGVPWIHWSCGECEFCREGNIGLGRQMAEGLAEMGAGVLEAGAVLLPLNFRLAPRELAYILNDAGVKVLFLEKEFAEVVDSFRQSVSTMQTFFMLDAAPQAPWLSSSNYEDILAVATPYRAEHRLSPGGAVDSLTINSGLTLR